MNRILGLPLLFIGLAGYAVAGFSSAPEIDASSGITAVTLIAGGLAVLKGRRRKKKPA